MPGRLKQFLLGEIVTLSNFFVFVFPPSFLADAELLTKFWGLSDHLQMNIHNLQYSVRQKNTKLCHIFCTFMTQRNTRHAAVATSDTWEWKLCGTLNIGIFKFAGAGLVCWCGAGCVVNFHKHNTLASWYPLAQTWSWTDIQTSDLHILSTNPEWEARAF